MSYQLVDKLVHLVPYEPLSGEYEVRLDANESFIALPNEILEKIQKEIVSIDFNRYPDPYCKKLCEAFAAFYEIDKETITAGNGSDELISIIVSTFLEKGQTIFTTSPDFSMYGFYSSLYETKNYVVSKDLDLNIDIDQLIKQVKNSHASIVILSNPCNPTSKLISRNDIRRLIKQTNSLVVVDEAYMDFADASIIKEVHEFDNLIVLKTCSKAFGLAAIRLGFAVACPKLTTALKSAKSPYNVNTLTQVVGEIVLKEKEYLNNCISQIVQSTNALYTSITQLQKEKTDLEYVYPTHTNFIFIKVNNSREIMNALLNAGIAIRQMGDCLRITAGSKQENQYLLEKLKILIN